MKECTFVGDRGVMTRDNLEALKQAGFRYVLGYQKRNRVVSDLLLERYRDLGSYRRESSHLRAGVPVRAVVRGALPQEGGS